MSKQTDDLQAQWILLSNWLDPSVLAHARASSQASLGKDLCDHLFELQLINADQVQQIRYAVQVQESKVQDKFQAPRSRLSDRLRKQLAPDQTESFVGKYLSRGQYKILEEVSRGGMGAVFRATQLAWNKTVAIKLLLGSHLNEQGLHRFRREVEILASLDHPNIAKILGHGMEEEQPFFVMEFIAGPTFEEIVEQHISEHSVPPEADEISRMLGSVANALNYTHSNDLIHRDVKPSNILISETFEHAVLVDFGLVKEENPASSSALRLSKSGELIGTLDFMSPEQLDPLEFGGQTAAVDVWSFGATLYFGLTGIKPFNAKNHNELLAQILNNKPDEPRNLNADVPQWLNELCLDCLTVTPGVRPTMAEIAQAMNDDEWVSGQSSSKLSHFGPRDLATKWSLVFMVTSVAIILLALFYRASPTPTETKTDETSISPVRDSKSLLAQLRSEDFRTVLAGLNSSKDWPKSDPTHEKIEAQLLYLLEHRDDPIRIETLKVLRHRGSDSPELHRSLFHQLTHKNPQVANEAIASLNRYGPKICKPLREVLERKQFSGHLYALKLLDLLSRKQPGLLQAYDSLLLRLLSSEKSRVAQFSAQLIARRHGMTSADYAKRGERRMNANNLEDAQRDFKLATYIDRDLPKGFLNLARVEIKLQNYSAALTALRVAQKLNPKEVHNFCTSSKVHFALGEYEAAIKDLSTALKIDSKHTHAYSDRAQCYDHLKQYKLAVADISEAIKLEPRNDKLYAARGTLHRKTKNWNRVESDFTAAIKFSSKTSVYYRRRAFNRYNNLKNYKGVDRDCYQYNRIEKVVPPDLLRIWADSAFKINSLINAESLYTTIINSKPQDLEALNARAEVLYAAKKWSKSARDFKKLFSLGYKSPQSYGAALVSYVYADRQEEARKHSITMYKEYPNNKSILSALILYQIKINKPRNAQIMVNRYFKLFPNDPQSHANFARIYYLKKNYGKAIVSVNRAIQMSGATPDFLTLKGKIKIAQSQFQDAIKDLTLAIQKSPNDPKSLMYRAIAYSKNNQPKLALKDIFVSYRMGHRTERVCSLYTSLLNQAKNHNQALKIGLTSIGLHRNHGPLYREITFACLGLAEASTNNRERALYLDQAFRYIKRSLTLGSLSPSKVNEDPRLHLLRQDPRYSELKRQF